MLDIASLLDDYAAAPARLQTIVQQTPVDGWDAKPFDDSWSIRQVVCHLADCEIVYADRMKRVLVEDNPTFFELIPDRFIDGLYTAQRRPEEELIVISAIRTQMFRILKACDLEDYQRTGVHSMDGPMTLETLLERITGHIPHHISFIERKLKALRAT